MEDNLDPFAPLDATELNTRNSFGSVLTKIPVGQVVVPVPDEAEPVHFAIGGLNRGVPDGLWFYHNEKRQKMFVVTRWNKPSGGKVFLPMSWLRHTDGSGEWVRQNIPAPRPLYRLDEIAKAASSTAVVVEGEKCADAAGRFSRTRW